MLTPHLKARILHAQRNELTEHIVYHRLAGIVKKKNYAEVLEEISREELGHYGFFKAITRTDVQPYPFKIFLYVLISRIFGLNFGLKLMEGREDSAQDFYESLRGAVPNIDSIAEIEKKHERALLDLIDEERLKYISSVVLGLNDALVELTATLAGFTLALQNTRLIGIVGLITGIAASMSMASSEYLSTKQEGADKNPLKAGIYTGLAYVGTVAILVSPYFFFTNMFLCLGLALANALLIILFFTFYISVAKRLDFKKRFLEMAALSLSIAAITFVIGMAIRKVFGVDI
ncbi:MAG: rubrerythrin family protein [Candidatus Omnitrophica bacterium]|nr:rubrerythrin family protein [Candidatus Omnitrophota bacterium]